jgi:hypothetical protein
LYCGEHAPVNGKDRSRAFTPANVTIVADGEETVDF